MSPVGTASLVTAIRKGLFSASSSFWQSSQTGPIWLTTCSPASVDSTQRHPRALGSNLPQGEKSSVTDTLSMQSLSAPGAVGVRFPVTLSGVTRQFLTACNEDAVQLPAKPSSTYLGTFCSYEFSPKQMNIFPRLNIINKSC